MEFKEKDDKKRFYYLIKSILIYSPLIKDKQAIIKYSEDYDYYTPIELQERFDGKISIIILDKNYCGKGLDIKMIQKIFEYAKKDDVRCLQILTDEISNFRFYERLGCNKIYEKTISNGEPNICKEITTEQGFIYEKKLKSR